MLDRVTRTLADELEAHDSFRLPGLGTLGTTERRAQRWFDPTLRRMRQLPARFAVYFHATRELKARLKRDDGKD